MDAQSAKVKLLRLIDAPKAYEILGEKAGLFGDNGGDSDGDEYLRNTSEFDVQEINLLTDAGVAEVVDGYEVYPYTESADHYVDWSGYSSGGIAFCLAKETADMIRRDGSRGLHGSVSS